MGTDKPKKKNPSIVRICTAFFIIEILIIMGILAWVYKNKITNIPNLIISIAISILTSLAASFIFALIQNGYENEENRQIKEQLNNIEYSLKRQNELYDSGIKSIHPKAYFDDEKEYWQKIINSTDNRLDLIGHSISHWFSYDYKDIFCNKVIHMLQAKKEIHIIMSGEELNIQNVNRVYNECDKSIKLNKVERSILELLHILDQVDKKNRKYLKIYFTDYKNVTYLYIRTDNECIISPYIQSPTDSQNSFLIELKPGTKYTKAFENDFRDFLEKTECLNLSLDELTKSCTLKEIAFYKVENQYSGSNWNNEKTEKYVLKDFERESKYEIGYFEHYLDETYIKTVIELPVSYGCPSKCKFCATSAINSFRAITPDRMMELFKYVYEKHKLYNKKYVVLSLTGSGDIFYNFENTEKFLLMLRNYKNVHITLSSCLWKKETLTKIEELAGELTFRYIQITYVSNDINKLSKISPASVSQELSINEIVNYIAASSKTYYRFNYIMIHGINDSEESWQQFIDLVSSVKNKIIVRISKLNETPMTIKNHLEAADIQVMKQFETKLNQNGIKSYVFYAYYNDHMNCGQLITEK